MRLRNETITLGLKRKELEPVTYQLIDCNNVRIGSKWFQFYRGWIDKLEFQWGVRAEQVLGVTIFHDSGAKQFIANSWYVDIDTDAL